MATGARTAGVASGPHVPPRLIPEADQRVDVVDTLTEAAVADGDGIALATFNPPADAETRVFLELVVVTSESAAPTDARIYVGAVAPAGLRDMSFNGNEDVAFENPPIYASPQQPIYVVWTGADIGATCVATIQYRVRG
jgi:hypothetical protein